MSYRSVHYETSADECRLTTIIPGRPRSSQTVIAFDFRAIDCVILCKQLSISVSFLSLSALYFYRWVRYISIVVCVIFLSLGSLHFYRCVCYNSIAEYMRQDIIIN